MFSYIKMNHSTFLRIVALVFAALLIAGSVYAWGSSGGSEQDCDRSGSTNAVDSHGNEVGLGCDSCSGGDGGGGDGGSDGYSCTPSYVSCYSEENICGWKNEGQIDISCGGSCSATQPEDPKFNINGSYKSVGDSCTVTDDCGNVYQGYVTCEGRCLTKNINSTCILPGDETPPDMSNLDKFDTVTTEINFNDLLTQKGLASVWPPDNESRAVALIAMPQIVKKFGKTRLYLALVGLDYCIVKGDNGDEWQSAGLSSVKYEYVKKLNKKGSKNKFSRLFDEKSNPGNCDTQKSAKDTNSRIGSSLNRRSEKRKETILTQFVSWVSTSIFGSRISLASLLGYNPTEEKAQNSIYSCPEESIELDENVKLVGSIAAFDSSELTTETIFTVEKCYSMDHNGKVFEYIPDPSSGDISRIKVKVAPRFKEL